MGGEVDPRRALIRAKNESFAELARADAEIHKRAMRGTVPAAWLRRRAELAARYEEALREWERDKKNFGEVTNDEG